MPNDIANNMADTIHQLEEDRIMLNTQLTNLQLAFNEQMLELKEAKRLLILAFPIINSSHRIDLITNPSTGKKELLKHYILDKALKLIGDETDEKP